MAQLVKTRRSSSHSPRTQTSPTFEQLLRVEDTYWTPRASLPKNDNDVHFQEDNISSPVHNKKSVLTKVKERAMKLRHSLSGNGKKKQGNEHTGDIIKSPSKGVELDKDPEYHGAPMYESEAAPETYKETDTQQPRAFPVVSKEHGLADNIERENDKVGPTGSDKTASKIVGTTPEAQSTPPPPPPTHDIPSEVKIMNESNKWDKGVSVREYFMNKLEPVDVDDDDRALSEAITDAISPTKTSGDSGVVEKVKDAVSSFFWHEDNSSSPNIPISTQVNEEENHGKILQAN